MRAETDMNSMRERSPDPWRRLLHDELQVLKGSEAADQMAPVEEGGSYSAAENVRWTARSMNAMELALQKDERIEVLNRCAHILPDERIAELRELFLNSHDIFQVHLLWQSHFLENLERRWGKLPPDWMARVIEEGWGEAGRIEGREIIATKVPQDLPGWFNAKSDAERRYRYCHCGRVRQVFLTDETIPEVYCNCGGGFYRSNWGRVIGRPVKVELRASLMGGGDRCTFAIMLPDDIWTKD